MRQSLPYFTQLVVSKTLTTDKPGSISQRLAQARRIENMGSGSGSRGRRRCRKERQVCRLVAVLRRGVGRGAGVVVGHRYPI